MLTKQNIHAVIEADQRANIQRLNDLYSSCKNYELQNQLTQLIEKFEGQSVPYGKDAYEHDQKIAQVIAELSEHIGSESYVVAQAKLKKLKLLLAQRDKFCPVSTLPGTRAEERQARKNERTRAALQKKHDKQVAHNIRKGLPIATLYKADELIEFMILQASEGQAAVAQELQRLHDKLAKNPNDLASLNLWKMRSIEYKRYEKTFAALGMQGQRVALVQATGVLTNEDMEDIAQGIAKGEIDNAKFARIMAKFAKYEEDMNTAIQQTGDAAGIFFDGTPAMGQAQGSAFGMQTAGQMQGSAFGTPAMGQAQAQQNAGGFGLANDPLFLQFGGMPDPNQQALENEFENVDGFLTELMPQLRGNDRAIEKLEMEREEVADELRDLLQQRRNASAAECTALDGQIDRLEKRHTSIKRAIALRNRWGAELSEMEDMANNVRSHRDIQEAKKQFEGNNLFKNFQNIAMAIKQQDKLENEELDNWGMANAVANSEEISQHTMRTGSVADIYNADQKDPNKYAELERELGMPG